MVGVRGVSSCTCSYWFSCHLG